MLPENYNPPLTLHRAGNWQMRGAGQGTKQKLQEGDTAAERPWKANERP
jgi:hypothetical protein